jgi:UDP-N-acetylglucosamine 2-epimerase (non-hydrolysing)
VGNVMVDSLNHARDRASQSPILEKLQLQPQHYAVVTMHHPSSVDNREVLSSLLDTIAILAEQIPIVFPVHPRTASRLQAFSLQNRLSFHPRITLTSPLGYLDFLKLLSASQFVLTDSSGIQEDTTVLGVPCLTLLENTERPETFIEGTNVLVGLERDRILEAALRILDGKAKVGCIPELWDGKTAQRIVDAIVEWWDARHPQLVSNSSSSSQQPIPVKVLGVRC